MCKCHFLIYRHLPGKLRRLNYINGDEDNIRLKKKQRTNFYFYTLINFKAGFSLYYAIVCSKEWPLESKRSASIHMITWFISSFYKQSRYASGNTITENYSNTLNKIKGTLLARIQNRVILGESCQFYIILIIITIFLQGKCQFISQWLSILYTKCKDWWNHMWITLRVKNYILLEIGFEMFDYFLLGIYFGRTISSLSNGLIIGFLLFLHKTAVL